MDLGPPRVPAAQALSSSDPTPESGQGSPLPRGPRRVGPPHIGDREAPLTDLRDLLDRVGRRAGWKVGEIRSRPFRVTYATARLQTLDRGAPVSPWTVEKEPGHGSRDMLEEAYGRLGDVRHRSEVVEYRVEQHFDWDGRAWVPIAKQSLLKAPVTPTAA